VQDPRRGQSQRPIEPRGPNLSPVQGQRPIRDEPPPTGRPMRQARGPQPDPRARGGERPATPYRESGYSPEQQPREQSGYRPPLSRAGSDRDGYDQGGYDQGGYDRRGYDRGGYDRRGYDRRGFDRPERQRPGNDGRRRRIARDEYDDDRGRLADDQRSDPRRPDHRAADPDQSGYYPGDDPIGNRDQEYPERDRVERYPQRYDDQGLDGQDYDRPDYTGQDYDRPDYTGPDYPEPDYTGPDYPEPDYTGQDYPEYDDEPDQRGRARMQDDRPQPAVSQRRPEPRGQHLPPYTEPDLVKRRAGGPDGTGPRKMTVARVAAFRGKELTNRGVQLFRRAATADGADQSGLTHLTYAVMANYAVDAALAVALANTLFFAAAAGESTGKVLLYLLITVAPFAVIAPFIGPLLDRVQNGRRIALAVCSFGRSVLAIIMAFNFDSWILYPCALGIMVLSKSFGVLKAALIPRVLPEQITLVKTNSRLTVFGLMAGGVSGAIAAAFAAMSNSSGALIWTALCGIAGGVLCIRIPSWVESTAGEIPVQHSEVLQRGKVRRFPPSVSATLWANLANRIETGFLALFIAFVVKTEYSHVSGFNQLLLLGIVGAAAGAGGFLGNALGARLHLHKPEVIAGIAVCCVALTTFVAMLVPGLAMGAVVGLVGSTSSSLAKVCLDSVIQDELPEVSRASAFGMSESALQLAWVGGGVVGLLLGGVLHLKGNPVYMLGFGVVTVLVVLALVQAWLARTGRALLPGVANLLQRRRSGSAGSTARTPAGGANQPTTRLGGTPPTAPMPQQHGSPQHEPEQHGDAGPPPARSASDPPRRGLRPRKAGEPR